MGEWLIAVSIGLVSGLLSGAFGVGGGIVTTPAIRWLLDAPALIAVGTPLPVIVPAALTGALSYHRSKLVEVRWVLVLAASGALTAVAGAVLADRVGGSVVLVGTAALIVWAAGDMLAQVFRPPTTLPIAERGGVVPVATLAAIGVLTGLYSGFFGLGGGFVLVPMLTRWLHLDLKRAIGTSLGTVSLLAVPGTVAHWYLGNVDAAIALALTVGVIPGAVAGAHFTLGARERLVRIGFAVILGGTGVALALSEIAGVGS